jgi:putative ABC transport system permease protein
MDRVILKSAARPRITAGLLGAFGGLALLLAAVGVYGVASYSVARRTREIGIRVALGARSGRISRLVLSQGLAPALVGLAVGLGIAMAAAPRLETLLFRVSPRDPVTLTVIPALLLLVAALASWIPARRALRIAPTEALKEE